MPSELDAVIARVREILDGDSLPDSVDLLTQVVVPIADLRALLAALDEAREEVRVLRWYGNKDCTAMADAVLDAASRAGRCGACRGTGTIRETHGQGLVEELSCGECGGTGVLP